MEQDTASNIQHHITIVDFSRALVTNPHVNLLFTPFVSIEVWNKFINNQTNLLNYINELI